jgi:hypothetical protein
VKDNLKKLGVEPQLMSVEQFGKLFKEDLAATVQLFGDMHRSRLGRQSTPRLHRDDRCWPH